MNDKGQKKNGQESIMLHYTSNFAESLLLAVQERVQKKGGCSIPIVRCAFHSAATWNMCCEDDVSNDATRDGIDNDRLMLSSSFNP